jgi:beta-N-acetylhexosaminidase
MGRSAKQARKGRKKRRAAPYIAAFFLSVILVVSCTITAIQTLQEQPPPPPPAELSAEERAERAESDLWKKAFSLAESFSDDELAGQVIMTAINGRGRLHEASRARLSRVKPGAVILFRQNLETDRDDIRRLIAEIKESARVDTIPPFIAVDHEGGVVHRFGEGIERLPSPLSYNTISQKEGRAAALRKIEEDARRSGAEIAALGFNLNLAPVAEILNDSNRRFLTTRAYGYNANFVADAATAFIVGMRNAGVLCVIKHFPGNSDLDPHKTLPTLTMDETALRAYAEPFRQVVSGAKPAGLMVSHAVVRAWDAERNASLSPQVIGEKIRGGLGFSRIVLTDDFAMGAVAPLKAEEAAVRAVAAGADMVIAWQNSVVDMHAALLAALRSGRIPRERLTEAAARVIREKLRLEAEHSRLPE